jgi:predicted nucleotidyltransferase
MKYLAEHTAVTETDKVILNKCCETIRKVDPSAEVILYGSRARGDAEPESDYDLLILIDGEVTLEKEDLICRQLYPLELETGRVLIAFVYSRQQWNTPLYRAMPFYKNIEREGVIL